MEDDYWYIEPGPSPLVAKVMFWIMVSIVTGMFGWAAYLTLR